MSQLNLSAVLQIVDEATRPLKQIQNQSELNNDSIEKLTHTIKQLNQTMSSGRNSQYNNSLRQQRGEFQLVKTAATLVNNEYQRITRTLTTLHQKTQQINNSLKEHRAALRQDAKSMAIGAIGAGYAASIPLKAFADAEDASMKLKVSMMDTSGQVASEFKQINELATKLGSRLPGTNADFQLMMATLVQQGISFKSILGGTGEAAGNLAVLLKMPFDQAAEFAAKMQDATQTAEKDMLSLMDTIQRTSYLGVDPSNMLGGFAKLGAGMKTIKQLGLDGANAMAPLLVMADQSGMSDLSSAGNALSKTFKAMLDQGKINKALAGTKLKMDFSDGKGEFGGLDKMFKELEKLKNFSTQDRLPIISDIFGNDAENIQILNLLIDKGQTGYNETIAKMKRQANLQTRINAQLSTLTNLWDQAKGAGTNAMVSIVEAIAPDIKEVVNRISEIAEKVSTWAKANPELIRQIANIIKKLLILKLATMGISYTFSLMFSGIFAIILGITKLGVAFFVLNAIADKFGVKLPTKFKAYWTAIKYLTRHIFVLIRSAFPLLGVAIRLLIMSLLTNPFTLFIAGLAIVIRLIYQFRQPIGAFITGFVQGFKDGFATTQQIISDFWEALKAKFTPLQTLVNWLSEAFTTFKGVINEMLTPMQATNEQLNNANNYGHTMGLWLSIVVAALIAMKTALTAVAAVQSILVFLNALRVVFIGNAIAAWAFVAPFAPILLAIGLLAVAAFLIIKNWQPISAFFQNLWAGIKERFTGAIDAIKSKLQEWGTAFSNFFTSKIQAAIEKINQLIGLVNKIPGINIPQIPNINTANTGTTQTKPLKAQAIPPLKAAGAAAPVTNHFAAPNITITGVTDPKQVGQIVEQKLKLQQSSQAAAQRRTFSDRT
ncbi:MAG: phage tail tape measure protein [Acinetobacter sp.]